MGDYQDLGYTRPNIAALDQTGHNRGNLSNVLDSAFIGIDVPVFECYHMVVTSVPPGASAMIFRNGAQYSFTFPVGGSEWDPSQPMLLRDGDEIDFLWNVTPAAAAGVLPAVTAFFRFDTMLPVNATYVTRPVMLR